MKLMIYLRSVSEHVGLSEAKPTSVLRLPKELMDRSPMMRKFMGE
jgi:hypothetical protein